MNEVAQSKSAIETKQNIGHIVISEFTASRFLNSTPKINVSAAIYFAVAAILLLLAVWHSKPFGNYTRLGAFLLIPAVLCCAAGIFRSSRTAYAQDDRYRGVLRALVCAALLYHATASISMLRAQGEQRLTSTYSSSTLLRPCCVVSIPIRSQRRTSTVQVQPSMGRKSWWTIECRSDCLIHRLRCSSCFLLTFWAIFDTRMLWLLS